VTQEQRTSHARNVRRPIEARLRSRAIAHAEKMANLKPIMVITVLYDDTDAWDKHYDFGCNYVGASKAIYNALPDRYWESGMCQRMKLEYGEPAVGGAA
jgi:hypothetical protein